MKVIIVGADAIGAHLAELFSKIKQNIVIIDEDESKLERISSQCDLLTIKSSNTPIQSFRDAGVKNADLFISVTKDENLNLSLCVLAKSMGAKQTVARVENDEFTDAFIIEAFKRAGVTSIIYPDDLAARDIIAGLDVSWVSQCWDVHGGALTMLGLKVDDGCEILNRPFKEVCGPDAPYHVLAIKRGGTTIIPTGNDMLLDKDYVYFMTTRDFIPAMKSIVGKEDHPEVKHVIIVGGGKTAARVVNRLPRGMKAKIFETSTARCEELNAIIDTSRVMVINADGRSVANLLEENIKKAQAFVALTGNAEANILACMTAQELGVSKTIAMIENMDYMNIAGNADIGTVINKQALTASYIYQLMLNGDVRNIRNLLVVNADVAEFHAHEGSRITSKLVRELALPSTVELGGLVRYNDYSVSDAIRYSLFQVVSFLTTTGMFNEDAAQWHHITWVVLCVCMFFGGCAGSTAGGFKCARGVIALKILRNELLHRLHPKAILPVKVNDTSINASGQITLIAFLMAYFVLCFIAYFIMILVGVDSTNSFTIALSCASNVGPTLGLEIGPTMSWSILPAFIKWILSALMLMGRLEIFTVLVIFTSAFWKNN